MYAGTGIWTIIGFLLAVLAGPAGPAWRSCAGLAVARQHAVAAVVNGRIYVFGGASKPDGPLESSIEQYDPSRDRWTLLDVASPRLTLNTAAALKGRVYVLIGDPQKEHGVDTPCAAIGEFNPATHQWRMVCEVPSPRISSSLAAAGGKLYLLGGYYVSGKTYGNVKEILEYNLRTGGWTRKADLPVTRHAAQVATVHDLIYVAGGVNDQFNATSDRLEAYDPRTDRWASLPALPRCRAYGSAAVVNGRLVLAGGYGRKVEKSFERLSAVDVYDPVAKKWAEGSPLCEGLSFDASAALEKNLYVIGGNSRPDAVSGQVHVLNFRYLIKESF